MGYVPDEVLPALRGLTRLGVFFYLATAEPLHLWMGTGEIAIDNPFGVTSTDPAGTTFLGAGHLLGIPDLELLVNGLADRIEFQLSGLASEHLAMLAADAPPVKGAEVQIGFAPLDERWQPLSSIIPLWLGVADFWTMEQKPVGDPTKPVVRTIMLSVGVGDTRRAAPRLTLFTDAQQKAVYPTDNFFNRVARYVPGLQFAWPRY